MKPSAFFLFSLCALFTYSVGLRAALACFVDTDCPGAECGGQVCDWSKPAGTGYTCVAAGTATAGSDGWCEGESDCKCASLGATCNAPHCSFTLASEAPAGDAGDAGSAGPTDGGDAAPPAPDASSPSSADDAGSPAREASAPAADAGVVLTCLVDTDCPGAECGGQVCDWGLPVPGTHRYTCVAAGTASQGGDGWCNTDTDCKCRALGATCHAPYCSFTLPSAAPAADASPSTAPEGSSSRYGSGYAGATGKSGGCAVEGAGEAGEGWGWAGVVTVGAALTAGRSRRTKRSGRVVR